MYQWRRKIQWIIFLGCVSFGLSGCIKNEINEYEQIISEMESDCVSGNIKACSLWIGLGGELIRSQDKEGHRIGMQIFQKACDRGFLRACYGLGLMYYRGEGVKQDYKNALHYFAKGCDLGDQEACEAYEKMRQPSNSNDFE